MYIIEHILNPHASILTLILYRGTYSYYMSIENIYEYIHSVNFTFHDNTSFYLQYVIVRVAIAILYTIEH